LLVSFSALIDESINNRVIALQEAFAARYFTGYIESVPAYSSLAVFYDPALIKQFHPEAGSAYTFVKERAEELLQTLENASPAAAPDPIQIPVLYNGADLDEVAALHKISAEELVQLHANKIYQVYMIGFQPGFAYMGKLDEKIATPRKSNPRTRVPAGAVGIAGVQTGIYPFASPGGWQLIGTSPIKLFDAERTQPCLLRAGDKVQFFPIDEKTYTKLNGY